MKEFLIYGSDTIQKNKHYLQVFLSFKIDYKRLAKKYKRKYQCGSGIYLL